MKIGWRENGGSDRLLKQRKSAFGLQQWKKQMRKDRGKRTKKRKLRPSDKLLLFTWSLNGSQSG